MRDKPQEERKPEYAKDRFDAEFAPHDDEGDGAQDDVARQIGDRDGDVGEVLDLGADAAETTADEAVRDDELERGRGLCRTRNARAEEVRCKYDRKIDETGWLTK